MIPASSVNGVLCTARHSRAQRRRRHDAESKPRFVASAETAANYDILSMSLSGRQLGGRTTDERASECWDGCDRLLLQDERANQADRRLTTAAVTGSQDQVCKQ